MNRRFWRSSLSVVFLIFGGPVFGQTAEEPLNIFLVVWRGETDVELGFRAHLRERGIHARYTLRDLGQDRDLIPEVVAEIQESNPDLVHTWGTSTTLGVFGPVGESQEGQAHVEGVPGVFSLVAYPVEAGIVQSFESTGRAVTGTSFLSPVETQLETMQAYRRFGRIAVIYNPLERNSGINVDDLRDATAERQLVLIEAPVPLDDQEKPDVESLPRLVEEIADQGAQFLYLGSDSFVGVNSAEITRLALEHGIPAFAPLSSRSTNPKRCSDWSVITIWGKLAGLQAERILVGKREQRKSQ